MKRPYLNASASFGDALIALVMHCHFDLDGIQELRAQMKRRLDNAAAVHGIDPTAVRRLVKMQQTGINYAPQEEIGAAYRAIVVGALPIRAPRAETEFDKVMQLVSNNKAPKIDDIMTAISCSRGKAHKLRRLAAARLAEKSSRSSELHEHELPHPKPMAVTPRPVPSQKKQEKMLRPAADRKCTLLPAESKAMEAPLDASNVIPFPRSD
jgi:hypothetical protein